MNIGLVTTIYSKQALLMPKPQKIEQVDNVQEEEKTVKEKGNLIDIEV